MPDTNQILFQISARLQRLEDKHELERIKDTLGDIATLLAYQTLNPINDSQEIVTQVTAERNKIITKVAARGKRK